MWRPHVERRRQQGVPDAQEHESEDLISEKKKKKHTILSDGCLSGRIYPLDEFLQGQSLKVLLLLLLVFITTSSIGCGKKRPVFFLGPVRMAIWVRLRFRWEIELRRHISVVLVIRN